jgi:hypothetical protein
LEMGVFQTIFFFCLDSPGAMIFLISASHIGGITGVSLWHLTSTIVLMKHSMFLIHTEIFLPQSFLLNPGYLQIHIYTHTHTHIYVCVYVYVYICVYVSVCVYMYRYKYIHIHTYIWNSHETWICIYINTKFRFIKMVFIAFNFFLKQEKWCFPNFFCLLCLLLDCELRILYLLGKSSATWTTSALFLFSLFFS